MKIIEYSVVLDTDRKNVLVKNKVHSYSDTEDFSNPESIRKMINKLFRADILAEEHMWLLALDTKAQAKGVFEITHGTVNASLVTPREVFIRLLLCGATGFVLIHNHPSGIANPSKEDKEVTMRFKQAGDLMCINLWDHIIIGNNYCYSFHTDKQLNKM